MTKRLMKKRIAVLDFETDPEDYDGEYLPFVAGFYDGYDFHHFWDRNQVAGSCLPDLVAHLQGLQREYLIYAHNGGKFDFMFLLPYIQDNLHIQNGRIVKAHLGIHELRDSFSIIPVKLADFKGKNQKKQFETPEEQSDFYRQKFSRQNRLKFKQEIIDYLRDDCLTLYEGVTGFLDEFGDKLTIGGTSMKQLKTLHDFQTAGKAYDERFRPFYFGGRNQCFEVGILKGDYKIYDVNSMYPFVMKTYRHPVSIDYEINVKLTPRTTFALIEAKNYGCLPVRTKTSLDFTVERGVFHASIHEINAGLETGTLEILRIKHTIEHKQTATFANFVDTFYEKRLVARANKREMLVTFYKLILNSAYGKFAQNPENYRDYIITHNSVPDDVCQPHCLPGCENHWILDQTDGNFIIWSRPSKSKLYFNVATAASITGAARAVLLRGLAQSRQPVYCDTDSIICKDLKAEIDTAQLGAWKREATGDTVVIAGKKLYCVFRDGKSIKQAAKGVIVTPKQLIELARGNLVHTKNPVPRFKLDGSHMFVSRSIKKTGKASAFGRATLPPATSPDHR